MKLRRKSTQHSALNKVARDGCGGEVLTRKVPQAYSPAEETAGSLTTFGMTMFSEVKRNFAEVEEFEVLRSVEGLNADG